MQKNLVITLTGQDRVGIVERLSRLVLEYRGNVDASRMTRLGGEFALLMLVTVTGEHFDVLREQVRALRNDGFKVTTSETEEGDPGRYAGWMPYQVELKGADHEGIVYNITRHLAGKGVNIESMETNMVKAPMSGMPLFTMSAIVVAPAHLTFSEWSRELEELGDQMNVEIEVSPYTG